MTSSYRRIHSRDTAVEYIETHLADATEEVLLSAPLSVVQAVETELRRAQEDGVLVVLLIYGTNESVAGEIDYDLEEIGSVVRVWDAEFGFTIFVTDQQTGLVALNRLLSEPEADEYGIVYSDKLIYHLAYGWFMAHPWERGTEWATADPEPLPAAFDDFRHGTFQATLWLRRDREIRVRATARPPGGEGQFSEIVGQVVSTRQQFVAPKLSSMFGETTILARTDDGVESFGGLDAYLEDYETRSMTLEHA